MGDFVAMGRVLLCVLLLAASVQLCVASTAEGALGDTELSDPVEQGGKSDGEAAALTTTDMLLKKMYKTIPYKAQCGALADDATNIESRAKMSFGACAVHCTAEFKCKSFEYDHAKGHCSISPRQLLTKTSAGAALACATKNVLVTSSMQLPSKPDVFTKRVSQVAEEKQEVQKEAKVDAKAVVQKVHATAQNQVTALTKKVEEVKAQKTDAETKEKVEEANAVKQIHRADKLKTEIKQEATVKTAVVEDKKQSQQKLAASQREVHQLRKQLAESQTETESTQVSLKKLKAPEEAPEKASETAAEKAAEEAPEKAAPQLEMKAERWRLETVDLALKETQDKIKKLKAKTSEISRGAVACHVMVPKLEARLKDGGSEAEIRAQKEKKELEKLTAEFDSLAAEEKTANGQRETMILKVAEEKKTNDALEEQLHQLNGNELELSKALTLAHDAANEHADKVDKYNKQTNDVKKTNRILAGKAKMKDVCEKSGANDIAKCKKESSKRCKNLEKKVNKKHEAYTVGAAGFRMCAAELKAAQSQTGEMREMIAKSETILTDHAAQLEASKGQMRDSVVSDLTPKLTKQARDTCNHKLEQAISKVANKKPISRKCQVCAKLNPKIQASLGVQCGDCN